MNNKFKTIMDKCLFRDAALEAKDLEDRVSMINSYEKIGAFTVTREQRDRLMQFTSTREFFNRLIVLSPTSNHQLNHSVIQLSGEVFTLSKEVEAKNQEIIELRRKLATFSAIDESAFQISESRKADFHDLMTGANKRPTPQRQDRSQAERQSIVASSGDDGMMIDTMTTAALIGMVCDSSDSCASSPSHSAPDFGGGDL